jgi:hypothetical protein
MKKQRLTEKVWNLNVKDQIRSDWKLTMDLRNEWEAIDDSTDNLEPNDKIDTELLQNLITKINEYDSKLGSTKNQDYDIVLHFLEHAKTVSQFEKAWDKFQEYMLENKIFIQSTRTNN